MRWPSARGNSERNAQPSTKIAASASCHLRVRRTLGSSDGAWRANFRATTIQKTMFPALAAVRMAHQTITPVDCPSIGVNVCPFGRTP